MAEYGTAVADLQKVLPPLGTQQVAYFGICEQVASKAEPVQRWNRKSLEPLAQHLKELETVC